MKNNITTVCSASNHDHCVDPDCACNCHGTPKRGSLTLDQFFERLPRTGWTLKQNRFIRNTKGDACPINCVAGVEGSGSFAYEGMMLGLSREDVGAIVGAADVRDIYLDEELKPLRARLLAHCGLTEARQ